MNLKRFSGGTLGLLALSALACACSSKADDCNANKNCAPYDSGGAGSTGTSGSAGTSGSPSHSGSGGVSGTSGRAGAGAGSAGTSTDAGAAGAPSTCDGTLGPDADNCVISDDYGVFVAPTGDDTTGDGTEAAPFATLTTALTKLDQIKRIYVCAAEYSEAGTLQIPSGVSIYGGFGCDGGAWTYDSKNNKASFKPQSPIGAEIKNASGVILEDLSITAADATGPGASSFGLMVVGSDGVALTRVVIKAGNGAIGSAGTDGTNGADGADVTVAAINGQNGHAAICTGTSDNTGPSWPAQSACNVRGGAGGTGYKSSDGDPGTTGVPLENIFASGVKNGGAGATDAGAAVDGKSGGDGSAGLPGINGAVAKDIGTFSATGYAVASGGDGSDGFPGQGGGGGGASKGDGGTCTGASGGAGGMGGCGGTHASGGKGGGASIGLLSWNSKVDLLNSSVVAMTGGGGGSGGKAGTGGLGKPGGLGGTTDTNHGIGAGGSGGKGGAGGNGGNGSGGTGGPSIAIVYSTSEPAVDNQSAVTAGTGGTPGAGGTYGNTATKASDGITGLAKGKYKVPGT
ncbi:MAG: hypothetical protein ABUL62_16095 [Myxococcales bacterium]